MLPSDSLEEWLWERHSNPKSGWSRTPLWPVILYAIYHRNWRLGVAAVVFTVANPVLFSPPEDDDAWMTRVVLAERWWTRERRAGLFDGDYPNSLNLLNIPVSVYAVIAAYRKRPIRAALAGLTSMALKFWYVGELVRRYDTRDERAGRDLNP